jgi:hypothetical protein
VSLVDVADSIIVLLMLGSAIGIDRKRRNAVFMPR